MSPLTDEFDLVTLGGGPGGYAAALYGAAAGLRIAVVEEERVGGVCLHRGCIPAKELLQTAEVLRTVRGAAEFGVTAGSPALDLGTSQERKRSVIERLTKGLEGLLGTREVEIVTGRGELAGDGVVRVAGGREIRGRHVVVATGSEPRPLPDVPFDGSTVLSSDDVLELTEVPGRVAVVGGGAIGCEFASFLADVGSEVTVLEALPQVLTGVDRQVAQVVVRAFKKRGVGVRTGVAVAGIDVGDGSAVVRVGDDGEERLEVDRVVVSIGRRPRTDGIGLDAAGVDLDDRGFVAVDERMRTSAPGVFAVGDVVGTPQLAHVGFAEGIFVVREILGEDPPPIEYDKVPWGIYCHPEVAFCGLTEEAATEAGHDVVTSVHRFGGNGRALIIGEPDGMVKIVATADGGVLLGVHIVGPWATELIAEGYLSVNWEATGADLGALIHAHPTLSELFGESALALTGRSLHG